jgi:hypothetical protein
MSLDDRMADGCPMPMPPGFVVKKGSHHRFITCNYDLLYSFATWPVDIPLKSKATVGVRSELFLCRFDLRRTVVWHNPAQSLSHPKVVGFFERDQLRIPSHSQSSSCTFLACNNCGNIVITKR